MGKAKKMGGPFLAAAVFCEAIMEDASGAVSAIKILDGVKFMLSPEAPDNFPSKEQPLPVNQHLLIVFRTGDSPGEHEVGIVAENPKGQRSELLKKTVSLSSGANGGATIKTSFNIGVSEQGLYLVDLYLDDELVTRMPLDIVINRLKIDEPKKKKK